MQHAEIAIAGAGIIGLVTALEFAASGHHVVVFERGYAMRESSWAAAGMLAAADPENPAELCGLSGLSRSLYPGFLATVERLSGMHVPIRTSQTLQGVEHLPAGVTPLTTESLQHIAPGLQPGHLQFFVIEEQSLDPRDLGKALPQAVKSAGVTLLEQTAVNTVRPQPDIVHIHTTAGEWSCRDFINASGAWASDLSNTPVVPRKGQVLMVRCAEPLPVVLRTPHLYLVPRGNGNILIGATVEDAGYDRQIDSNAIAALHAAAAELWAPIRHAEVIETWSGLRPAAPDLLPILGPDAEKNTWLALGHFRNGILLAPATALLLRQMVFRQPLSCDATAFQPQRFAATSA